MAYQNGANNTSVPIGDRGQRYQVTQVKCDGTSLVWGWTNEINGGKLASAAQSHPDAAIVRVVDRGEKKETHT